MKMRSFFDRLFHSPISGVAALLLVVLAWSGYAYCAEPQTARTLPRQAPQRTLRVSYEFAQSSLPLFIAIEQGYFSRRNIRVELQQMTATSRFDISSDSWDLNVGVPIAKLPDNKGLFDYVRLFQAQYMTKNGDPILALVVRADIGIKSADDLKGKTLVLPSVFPGLYAMLGAKGISPLGGNIPGMVSLRPSKLQDPNIATRATVGLGSGTPSPDSTVTTELNTGSDYLGMGDGSYTWGEDALNLVESKKGKFTVLDKNLEAKYICDPFYINVSLVRAGLFASDPGLVWDALQALDEAVSFIQKNPRTAKGAIPKTFTGYTPLAAQELPLATWHLSSETPIYRNLRMVKWNKVSDLEQDYLVRTLQNRTGTARARVSPASAKPSPPLKSADELSEERDWNAAIESGTQQAYIAFHKSHPTSNKLTVLQGAIRWSGAAGRDSDVPGGYRFSEVTVGGTSTPPLSVTIPEFLILGLATAVPHGVQTTYKFKTKYGEYASVTDGIVLISDQKVVACFEKDTAPETMCQDAM